MALGIVGTYAKYKGGDLLLETSVINDLINESVIWIENNLFSVENLIDIIILLFQVLSSRKVIN